MSNTQRIEGAKAAVAALIKLTESARNLPDAADDAKKYAEVQAGDAQALVEQFGPLTPHQEGAFMALAEYIHFTITTGEPNLQRWAPFVAMAPEEVSAWAEGGALPDSIEEQAAEQRAVHAAIATNCQVSAGKIIAAHPDDEDAILTLCELQLAVRALEPKFTETEGGEL